MALIRMNRRLDLIGNLVDAAKKYMEHEKETLMAVTQARSGLLQATQVAENNPGQFCVMNSILNLQFLESNYSIIFCFSLLFQ
jgi:LemA protein